MTAGWISLQVGACALVQAGPPSPASGTEGAPARTRAAGGASVVLDRAVPPALGRPPSLRLPEPHDYTLPNGLRVVLVERHELPVVGLQLLFRGGASAHPAERAGLAALTADMLDEGTTTRSALDIAAEIELLGATLVSSAGYDASAVLLSVLRPRLDAALRLLADVVVEPTFPENELERVRDERLGRILQREDRPAALADDAFARALYGTGHPYGAPLLGTRETLSALDAGDVRAFHRARYAPGQGTLVVAGDVGREELDALLSEAFAGWTGAGEAPPPLPDPPASSGRAIVLVDRPGSSQSEVRVGRVAVARSTPAYHGLAVTNTLLGGSFTSRLNAKLREEKGYTYGAFSGFDMRRAPGPFEASTAVATPVTAGAVGDLVREVERLGDELAPEGEVERARNFLALRLPQRFETAEDVVARLAELALHDVPVDFYDDYVDRILSVGPEEVRDLARRELDPGRMTVVVVGDRARVEEPLRALGLGPVEVVARPAREGGA